MDPSALIFVALALAWAAYLIPRALEHHEESVRSRSIDRFSDRTRVLARREPVGRRTSALVRVTPGDDTPEPEPDPQPALTDADYRVLARAHSRATVAAARRRRRVLGLLLLATAVVAGVAIAGLVRWPWIAVPAGLVLGWLVLCRVSVRRQRRRRPVRPLPLAPKAGPVAPEPAESEPAESADEIEMVEVVDETGAIQVVPAARAADVAGWDPLPIMVPTYVAKEQVRRSVRTIDLDSTGVWSSGRSDIDSALVQDSDAAVKAARAEAEQAPDDDQELRASGS